MSEILVDFITTLDGYASGDGWPGWWGLEGPEYLGWLETQPESDHTILMGATTYRLMSGFAQEGLGSDEAETMDGLAQAPKVVVSSTLEEPLTWPNTELVSGDAVEALQALKAEGNRSFRTMGSQSLCRSLLRAGLVDRFRVAMFPVITGATGSERIYHDYPDLALEMTGSLLLDGRIQVVEYAPTLLGSG